MEFLIIIACVAFLVYVLFLKKRRLLPMNTNTADKKKKRMRGRLF